MAALCLDCSRRLHLEARAGFDSTAANELDDGRFFDLLEKRIGSVVFAYMAVECFANESIHNAAIGEEPTPSDANLLKREFVALRFKLDETLPELFGVTSPKGTQVWEEFGKA